MTIEKLATVFSNRIAWMRPTNAVAGTLPDLETVGEGLALAKVDKVGIVTCEVSRELVEGFTW
jgi:hypothetical protein